jgi:hypothetical protein
LFLRWLGLLLGVLLLLLLRLRWWWARCRRVEVLLLLMGTTVVLALSVCDVARGCELGCAGSRGVRVGHLKVLLLLLRGWLGVELSVLLLLLLLVEVRRISLSPTHMSVRGAIWRALLQHRMALHGGEVDLLLWWLRADLVRVLLLLLVLVLVGLGVSSERGLVVGWGVRLMLLLVLVLLLLLVLLLMLMRGVRMELLVLLGEIRWVHLGLTADERGKHAAFGCAACAGGGGSVHNHSTAARGWKRGLQLHV